MDLCPPPKPQAYEMLWCASQCGGGTVTVPTTLTSPSSSSISSTSSIGSSSSSSSSASSSTGSSPDCDNVISDSYLSVLAAEMKRAYNNNNNNSVESGGGGGGSPPSSIIPPASKIPHLPSPPQQQQQPTATEFISKCKVDKSSVHCEVFLGGACNPTTWRKDVAVPFLSQMGIAFFNPQVTDWDPGLIELENKAKENADLHFFVIDNQTRGIVVMIELAYVIAKKKNMVLVINGFKQPGQRICNEPISQIEYDELTRSQLVLQQLVERHGLPVFNDIPTALNCTAKILREKVKPKDIKLSELVQPSSNKNGLQNSAPSTVLHLRNKLINLRKVFENLDSKSTGEINRSQVRLAYQLLTNQELTREVITGVLDDLRNKNKAAAAASTSSQKESSPSSSKKSANGTSHTLINFDQFHSLMSQLTCKSSCSPERIKNLEEDLTQLLEYVPSTKNSGPGWMPAPEPDTRSNSTSTSIPSASYDVFLLNEEGNNGKEEDEIVPILNANGLTSSNKGAPSSSTSSLILINVPSNTRSIECMTKASYYIGLGYEVVLCIGNVQDDCQIKEEKLSKNAVKDYNRARTYLTDIAKNEGIPVFQDIKQAVECVIQKFKSKKNNSKKEEGTSKS